MTPQREGVLELLAVLFMVALGLAFMVGLSGCSLFGPRPVETVEVQVPIPVRVLPPAELYAPLPATALPEWIGPLAPGAMSCLTVEGETRLKSLLLELEARRQALREWAGHH